ncbi:MAG TPA: hypothetical protein VEK15_10100 [Vicinamibacteria bacterium]|nr:hypothetical protein [Vicinamibacteria bacterium]
MVIEGGRLSLVPELQGVRAGKHIVESLVAIYGVALNVPCLLVCFSHHQALYETLGFRRIFHHDIIRAPSGQQRGVCMYGVRIKSARVFLRAVAMAQAYRQFGAIAYHRQRPDNFAPAVIRPELIDRAARIVSRIAA